MNHKDRKTLVDRIAEERLQTILPGDVVKTDDGARRYRAEHHQTPGHKTRGKMPSSITLHREIPKVRGKAARAAEKKTRRLARWEKMRQHVRECVDVIVDNTAPVPIFQEGDHGER